MNVPLLDLKQQHSALRDELRAAIERVFEAQQFILVEDVRLLETELASYTHTRSAVGCASCSEAVLLALMALDISARQEVVTTPFTSLAITIAIAPVV